MELFQCKKQLWLNWFNSRIKLIIYHDFFIEASFIMSIQILSILLPSIIIIITINSLSPSSYFAAAYAQLTYSTELEPAFAMLFNCETFILSCIVRGD